MNDRRSYCEKSGVASGAGEYGRLIKSACIVAWVILVVSFRAEANTEELAYAALGKLPGFEFAVGPEGRVAYSDGVFIADIGRLDASVSVFQTNPEAGQPWHAQVISNNSGRFSFQTISQCLAEDSR